MKKIIVALLVAFALICSVGCGGTKEEEQTPTVVHFIDVANLETRKGSADCVLIEDSGKVILIDCGENNEESKKKIAQYLRGRGIGRIDHLILTHAHSDHAGGMKYVIERFDIGNFYAKPVDWDLLENSEKQGGTPGYYREVTRAIADKINTDDTVPEFIEPKSEGYKVEFAPGAFFEIYNATKIYEEQRQDDNYNHFSFGIKLSTKHLSAYFAGDSTDRLDPYVRGRLGECQMYKLNHHGTDGPYSSLQMFEELKPEICIVTGLEQFFGAETRQKCEAADAEVYVSETHGDIVITAVGRKLSVTPQKS